MYFHSYEHLDLAGSGEIQSDYGRAQVSYWSDGNVSKCTEVAPRLRVCSTAKMTFRCLHCKVSVVDLFWCRERQRQKEKTETDKEQE